MAGLSESAWLVFWATAVKSVAVLGAAWLAAAGMRKRSAASRHVLWTAAFLALLALPLLQVSMPPLSVAGSFLPNVVFESSATSRADSTAAAESLDLPALRSAGVPMPAASGPRRFDTAFWVMALWIAGAAAALLHMLAAMFAMGRARRSARAFADDEANGLAAALGIHHPVALLEAPEGSMPMAFGVRSPAVLMPSNAAQWSAERRRIVLLHELAHVRRGDAATHLLARLSLSLFWWNPLAWTAWRSFLKERERATDDLVLATGARASDYAGHLLEIARQMQGSPALGWAGVAMARPSQLEGRLLAILDARMNRKAPGRAAAAFAALLAIAIVAPLAAVQSQDPAAQSLPVDVDATIRSANAQKNHDLLDSAAKAAITLRQYDLAEKLLQSAAAIRMETSGDRSADYAAGLIKLGDLERQRNKPPEATAFYLKAVGILGNQPQAAPAYLHLGILAIMLKDYEGAIGYFQQAQIADPSKAGTALMWTGLVRQRQGDFTAAESAFRAAMAIQGSEGLEASVTMDLYSSLLEQLNRKDEAASMRMQAADARKPGHTPAPAPLSTSAGVYRVGGGVSAPSLLYKMEPEYSEEARIAKYQGTVVLYVEIGPDGMAHNARIVRALGLGLDQKAIDAVSQWKFKPGMKDGAPVTVAATIEVNFRLL